MKVVEMKLREKLNENAEKIPGIGRILTKEVGIKELGTLAIGVYMALVNAVPALAETSHVTGYADFHAYYDGGTERVEPYGEFWLKKPFPHGFSGEIYAFTIAEEGDITGVLAEGLAYYNLGRHFGMNGLSPWAEYVALTKTDDITRGGLMWLGKPWKNAFLIARVGYGDNMEGEDLHARIIFNQNLPHGFAVGFGLNSNTIKNEQLHAEVPRLYLKLTDNIGLEAEVTYDRKLVNGEADEKYGVRGGLRVSF